MACDRNNSCCNVNSDMQRDKEIAIRQNVNNCNSCEHTHDHSCGCVGYGYVPWHTLDTTYCPDKALVNGTMFPELDLKIEEYGNICKGMGM